MSKTTPQSVPRSARSTRRSPILLRWLPPLVILALMMVSWPARADDPDDLYQRMYMLVQQGDSLDAAGQSAPALAKYREAQSVLRSLVAQYPLWNTEAVSYRLDYLAEKIAALGRSTAKPAPSGPATAPPQPTPEAKPAAAARPFQAKLLEAGAQPRKLLRLHPPAGDKQTLTLMLTLALDIQMAQLPSQPVKLPPIQMTLDTTVKSVSPNGDIHYDLAVGNATVAEAPGANPQIAQLITSAFSGLKGLPGAGIRSDRGLVKETAMKSPGAADPQFQQVVELLHTAIGGVAMLLPEEPVGPGARWEVKMPVASEGMTMDQTATYQLVSLEGNRLTLKDTFEQSATNQKIQNPAMPGLTASVVKMTTTGSGNLTWDLTRLLPQAGSMVLSSERLMDMDIGGQKNRMHVKATINLSLEGK